ncbi:hypothetical protein EPI10_023806 [Gossypium australe]|uniref:Uncharacterized protein n=1 Tax=Gossypium australe TaxID=47621 RepID=A0A5B6VW48_9ROSI|nr:hypothetical protein EPI10_023806 [Gossypium australe]
MVIIFHRKSKGKKSLKAFKYSATIRLNSRSRTEENGLRSRESESKRVVVSIPINRIRGLTLMGGILALQMAYIVTRSWHTGVPKDRG